MWGSSAWGSVIHFLKRCLTHIIPSADNTYDLGSSSKAWRNIYAAGFIGGKLVDADGDTMIQVEESADEDQIRFDTGGTERMRIGSDGHVYVKEGVRVVYDD